MRIETTGSFVLELSEEEVVMIIQEWLVERFPDHAHGHVYFTALDHEDGTHSLLTIVPMK